MNPSWVQWNKNVGKNIYFRLGELWYINVNDNRSIKFTTAGLDVTL